MKYDRAHFIERIARCLALWHGQKMVLHNRDGNQTIASLHGYGHWGDAPARYANQHWQEYTSAAEFVMRLRTRNGRGRLKLLGF